MLQITGLPFYTIVCLLRLSSLITDAAVVSGAAVDAPSLMVALPCYYNSNRYNHVDASATVISGGAVDAPSPVAALPWGAMLRITILPC